MSIFDLGDYDVSGDDSGAHKATRDEFKTVKERGKIAVFVFISILAVVAAGTLYTWIDRGVFASESKLHETSCKLMLQERIEQASSWDDYAVIYLQAPQKSPTETWAYKELVNVSSFGELSAVKEVQQLKRRFGDLVVCQEFGSYAQFHEQVTCSREYTFTLTAGGEFSDQVPLDPRLCELRWEREEGLPLAVDPAEGDTVTYLPQTHPEYDSDDLPHLHKTHGYTFGLPERVISPEGDTLQVAPGTQMDLRVYYVPCK